MVKKILHFVTNEKFTDYAISQFYDHGMVNDFVYVKCNVFSDNLVKHIDKTRYVSLYSTEFYDLLLNLDKYCAVVLHGMHWGEWEAPVIRALPDTVKLVWVFWGGDLYGRSDLQLSSYMSITNCIFKFRCFVNKTKKISAIENSWEIPLHLYQRVDICLTDEEEEYKYARNLLNNSMKFMWYNYYSLEQMLGALYGCRCDGENILLGNSATVECNYFDMLLHLKFVGVSRRKIYTPLSYGAPWIKRNVKSVGKLLFGRNYRPLTKFIPLDEYNKILQHCCVMIMAHQLPQAQGNIIAGLWLGMRVYLSENNMSYHYFKRIGCTVYSIEKDLKRSNPHKFDPMTDEEIENNRSILKSIYSNDATMSGVRHIIDELIK